jgi:hypothetical protein
MGKKALNGTTSFSSDAKVPRKFLTMRGLNGGPCRDRTYDQLIKSQLLYQLS